MNGFWRDKRGNLTVEAALLVPLLCIVLSLFLRWRFTLRQDLQDAALGGEVSEGESGRTLGGLLEGNFLFGGPPARRVRDADFLIDLSYSVKERLPSWHFPEKD